MVRHGKTALAAALALSLSGCGGADGLNGLSGLASMAGMAGMAGRSGGNGGGAWVHSTKAPGDFATDQASCRQQAIEKVQSSHQRQEAPKWITRATGSTSYYFDGNDSSREQWHKSCLQMMGWSQAATAALPGWLSPEMINAGLQYIAR